MKDLTEFSRLDVRYLDPQQNSEKGSMLHDSTVLDLRLLHPLRDNNKHVSQGGMASRPSLLSHAGHLQSLACQMLAQRRSNRITRVFISWEHFEDITDDTCQQGCSQ
jgi:hypothetical protein